MANLEANFVMFGITALAASTALPDVVTTTPPPPVIEVVLKQPYPYIWGAVWAGLFLYATRQIVQLCIYRYQKRVRQDDALIDFLVEMRMTRENVNLLCSDAATESMKKILTPLGHRAVPVVVLNEHVFENVRLHRREISMEMRDVQHELIESVKLFYFYYEKLGSDGFEKMSPERKAAFIDMLPIFGKDIETLHEKFLQNDYIDEFAKNNHIKTRPQKNPPNA